MIQIKKEQIDQMLKQNSQRWQRILLSTSCQYDVADCPKLLISPPSSSINPSRTTSSTSFAHAHARPFTSPSSSPSSSSSSSSSSTSPIPTTPPHPLDDQLQLLSQYGQNCYGEKCPRSSNNSGSASDNNGSSSNGKKRRRGNLPKTVTSELKQWLADHCQHPYPREEEKLALQLRTGLTLNQISNWFINARRRILPLLVVRNQTSSTFLDPSEEEQDLNDENCLRLVPVGNTATQPSSYLELRHMDASLSAKAGAISA
ncbi:hypothetical protein BX666DRAFT_2119240 [Dichotomocladium elegans]|nr:hypothetical protein BX666DRAFT_2119240 [Dichotomocladium elegans]